VSPADRNAPIVPDGPRVDASAGPRSRFGPERFMQDTFRSDLSFADLGLRDSVLRGVEAQGFEHPTHIQASIIPPAIEGRHILGQAKTGTGKTASFGLPALQTIEKGKGFQCLILVPTRELAIQVAKELRELGRFTPLRVLAVYGGQRIREQVPKLEKDPEILVGTPGRVMDLKQRRLIHYDNMKLAVLDEVDRMLDIGFRDDIRKILGEFRGKPQTIFVSATISDEIEKLARRYMVDPEKIVTSERSLTVSQVAQSYLSVQPWDKRRLLHHLLTHEEPALTLVFCRTKRTVDGVTKFLQQKKIDVHAMHGDMYQRKRNKVMTKLREGGLSVLVASDLAARGLDVDDISHVINFDLPEDPEVYVHRIGRTARAGRNGIAWSFVTPEQGALLTAIEHLANVEIPRLEYPDFKPGPVPPDVVAQQELKRQRDEDQAVKRQRNRLPDAPDDPGDPTKFPGGVVPAGPPPKRMRGRARLRR
jgi:ATP-dependent RNA helicase DeaD